MKEVRFKHMKISYIIGLLLLADICEAEIYGEIEFPNGALSFADEVIRYDPYLEQGEDE